MSAKVWPLLKVQFRQAWRSFRGKVGGESKWGVLLIPLLGLAFLPMIALLTTFYLGLYVAAKAVGEGQTLLVLAFSAAQLVCLGFGVFYVISSFYFSRDLSLLVPMPIRPGEIMLSKLLGIMIGEYLTMLPVLLPALVVYGIMADVSWLYIPFALIIYLLLPVVPLVLSSLFSMVLMRVTNMRRHRDLLRVIGALFGIGLGLGFNYLSQFMTKQKIGIGPPGQSMEQLLEAQRAAFQSIGRLFPTSTWAAGALQEGASAYGVPSFLLFAAVAAGALLLLLWAADKLFFGGLLGGEEGGTSGRVLSKTELARETGRSRTPLWALVQRESRLLNRTPAFLMAGLLPILLVPLFSLMPVLQEPTIRQSLPELYKYADWPLIPIIALGVILMLQSMSNLAATAISREGRYFWISRCLPVAPRVQVQAKLVHVLLFTSINIVMVLGVLAFLRILTLRTFLVVLIGGMLANTAAGFGGIIIDLIRPNLRWSDPQQAMKGNMNGLVGLVFTLVNGLVLTGVTFLLYQFAGPFFQPGVLLLIGTEALLFGRLAMSMADRRYPQYEE